MVHGGVQGLGPAGGGSRSREWMVGRACRTGAAGVLLDLLGPPPQKAWAPFTPLVQPNSPRRHRLTLAHALQRVGHSLGVLLEQPAQLSLVGQHGQHVLLARHIKPLVRAQLHLGHGRVGLQGTATTPRTGCLEAAPRKQALRVARPSDVRPPALQLACTRM